MPADAGDFEATPNASDCYEYRIEVEMTWNPTDQGPNNAGLFLYRGDGLGTCIAKEENADGDLNPVGENGLELSIQGSRTFDGENANGTQVSNPYAISSKPYTMGVQGRYGVADLEATATAFIVSVK